MIAKWIYILYIKFEKEEMASIFHVFMNKEDGEEMKIKNSYSQCSRGRAFGYPTVHTRDLKGESFPPLEIPPYIPKYEYANAHAHAIFYFHAHAHEYAHANYDLCSALCYGGKLAAFMPSAWLRLPIKGMREQEHNKRTSKEIPKIGIKHLTPHFNLW